MTRRTLISRFTMAIVALAASFALSVTGSTEASAQCCNYKVEIVCAPAPCLPITVKTVWAGGFTWTTNHTACGITTVTPGPCPLPGFQYLNINGNPTIIVPNQPVRLVIGGCCYMVDARFIGGCLNIKISRC